MGGKIGRMQILTSKPPPSLPTKRVLKADDVLQKHMSAAARQKAKEHTKELIAEHKTHQSADEMRDKRQDA